MPVRPSVWQKFSFFLHLPGLDLNNVLSEKLRGNLSAFSDFLISRDEVWSHPESGRALERGWRSGIPASRRLELGTRCVAMRCDEVSRVI